MKRICQGMKVSVNEGLVGEKGGGREMDILEKREQKTIGGLEKTEKKLEYSLENKDTPPRF